MKQLDWYRPRLNGSSKIARNTLPSCRLRSMMSIFVFPPAWVSPRIDFSTRTAYSFDSSQPAHYYFDWGCSYFLELEALISPFMSTYELSMTELVKWIWEEGSVSRIMQQLQRYKSTFSLILNIVQWYITEYSDELADNFCSSITHQTNLSPTPPKSAFIP